MKIIDPHHHFWSVKSGKYPWLEDESLDWLWGKPTDLPREYFPADLKAAAGPWELVKSVHLQCFHDPGNPANETRWLQNLADAPDSDGFPHGIVGFADLSSPDLESILAQHCECKNIRGIRHILNRHSIEKWNMSERDFFKDETWWQQFGLLKKYELSFDLQLYYHQVDEAIKLAHLHPDILIILNHAGMPADREAEHIEGWKVNMKRLAECDNVVAKISGLGMCDKEWTTETIRPFVLHMIDVFGVERSMFASNFPVDSLFSDYPSVWNAYDQITAHFSSDERSKLFHDNAEKYYRI